MDGVVATERPKVVCTIEARMASSRLPGKVLLPILGKPMLELLVERVHKVDGMDEVVIATSLDPACDAIEALADRLGVRCFRVSEEDVLQRVIDAVESVNGDVAVRATADNPLIDPAIISHVLAFFLGVRPDYCSTFLDHRTLPWGMDVEIVSQAAMAGLPAQSTEGRHHEHPSLYILENRTAFDCRHVTVTDARPSELARLTVDTPDDYRLVSRIFEELYPSDGAFTLGDIEGLIARRPALLDINRHVEQRQPVR